MSHRPVCVKCQVELRVEQNGFGVLDFADFGEYQLWSADKYKCPKCSIEIVIGFGNNYISTHYCEDFEKKIALFRATGLVENHIFNKDKQNG